MSFLVDTCAISELIKPRPSPAVAEWFEDRVPDDLFISVLTVGEIRKGVEKLGRGHRRASLATWLETEMPGWFENRILPVDIAVADQWGRLLARHGNIPAVDGLIAATALRHRLTVVTRNEKDFALTGVDLVNPWNE